MKRDKLYAVNQYNRRGLVTSRVNLDGRNMSEKNLFAFAGPISMGGIKPITENYVQQRVDAESNSGSGFNFRPVVSALGAASPALTSVIGGGYSTGGVGEGVAGVGNTVGSAVSAVNPIIGGAIQLGSSLIGGLTNRIWGTKENAANIAAIDQNTAAAQMAGNALADSTTNDQVLAAVGNMTGTTGFNTGDLYTGGWARSAKRKAARKGMKKLNAENSALAFQAHGAMTGIQNADMYNDNSVMGNFGAFGGPLEQLGDPMGAIEYGFISDYLLNKKRQVESNNRQANLLAKPVGTVFDFGGTLGVHGGDFGSGLVHIDAGQSHEENPNEGVQMGVDENGIPNLVEEGETVWNDYVFSNRILADEATKQMFRLPKKKDVTFADISKRLEKEIAERPNDPISKAGFNAQMGKLEEQQERQKQEMEAERAKAAFEALSPKEQTALMQRLAQEEAQANISDAQQGAVVGSGENTTEMQGEVMPNGVVNTVGQPDVMDEQAMMAEGGVLNQYAPGGPMRNAGTWKTGTSSENWNTYTRNGLRDYLNSIIKRINAASTDAEKEEIRQEAIKTVGDIQQAYAKAYQSSLTPSKENENVRTLQRLFQNANGNAYFGNISDNINLPAGHNTTDTEKGGYVDALWGPRTSIRNWGSTEYGDADYYKDLADLATQAGLVYAPNTDWTYGDNQLYGLSMPTPVNNEGTAPTVTPTGGVFHAMVDDDDYIQGELDPNIVGAEVRRETLPNGDTVIYHDRVKTTDDDSGENEPKHRAEWLRYAGLFGPAVGLGLMAAGVGKPKTKDFDAVLDAYNRRGSAFADYEPIGNYLTYRPMDVWAEQNRMNAGARATDRAIQNNASPVGTKIAGLLASNYNEQLGSGQLYRNALEYNDNLRRQVADFNRATDMFNASAYNQASQTNAQIANHDRALRAQLGMQAAAQRADADAGWYNSLYGNLSNLFRGISNLGRENEQYNWLSDLAADGYFGNLGNSNTGKRWVKKKTPSAAYGGKLRKRGLTI